MTIISTLCHFLLFVLFVCCGGLGIDDVRMHCNSLKKKNCGTGLCNLFKRYGEMCIFFFVANAKKSKMFRMKLCFVHNLIY